MAYKRSLSNAPPVTAQARRRSVAGGVEEVAVLELYREVITFADITATNTPEAELHAEIARLKAQLKARS